MLTIKLHNKTTIDFILRLKEEFDCKFLSVDTLYGRKGKDFYAYYLLHINFNPRKQVKF
jgi:hypothetical protein